MLYALLVWVALALVVVRWAELAERRYRRLAGLPDVPHSLSPSRFGWATKSRQALIQIAPNPTVEAARIRALRLSRIKYPLCLAAAVPATILAYAGLAILGKPFDDRLLFSQWAIVAIVAEVWSFALFEGSVRQRVSIVVVGALIVGFAILRATAA